MERGAIHLVLILFIIGIVFPLLLLLSGKRVLVHERIVHHGEVLPEDGNRVLSSADREVLVCEYFTGRSFVPRLMNYSVVGAQGTTDSCPFLVDG